MDKPAKQGKRGPYISESIMERRRRILEVAKEMMAEDGAEGFTVRELGRRAGVSVTTIYAGYGDKENLIASAIEDFYEHLSLAHTPPPSTLDGILSAVDEAWKIIRNNRAYVLHVTELYFSRTVDPRIYAVVRNLAVVTFLPWLQKTIREGDVIPGLTLEVMCTALANARWTVLFDWASGRIPDDQLALSVKTSFLMAARGITTKATQERVSLALRRYSRLLGNTRSTS